MIAIYLPSAALLILDLFFSRAQLPFKHTQSNTQSHTHLTPIYVFTFSFRFSLCSLFYSVMIEWINKIQILLFIHFTSFCCCWHWQCGGGININIRSFSLCHQALGLVLLCHRCSRCHCHWMQPTIFFAFFPIHTGTHTCNLYCARAHHFITTCLLFSFFIFFLFLFNFLNSYSWIPFSLDDRCTQLLLIKRLSLSQ